jgi:hypothetical protein
VAKADGSLFPEDAHHKPEPILLEVKQETMIGIRPTKGQKLSIFSIFSTPNAIDEITNPFERLPRVEICNLRQPTIAYVEIRDVF